MHPFDDRTSLLTMDILGFIALSMVSADTISALCQSYLEQHHITLHLGRLLPMQRLLSKPRPHYRSATVVQNISPCLPDAVHDVALSPTHPAQRPPNCLRRLLNGIMYKMSMKKPLPPSPGSTA
jgi:hypothetical protein